MSDISESRRLALEAAAQECTLEEYAEMEEHIRNLPLSDQLLMSKVIGSFMDRVNNVEYYLFQKYFNHWKETDQFLKKHLKIGRDRVDIVSIMKTSKRGKRSELEKEVILRYMTQHCNCLPHQNMTISELDYLCNNVDFYPIIGWSLIFLQGDFGNCYYMIATGSVSLYLEQSRDQEMKLARDYGNLRSKKFIEDDIKRKDILAGLGKHIVTLESGSGFGEYAILSSTQKLRSCAAVSTNDDTLLFILDEKVYNEVLRKHHFRQRNLTNCIKLLQEIPVIKSYSHSKISQLAYTMNFMHYSGNKRLISSGDIINKVLVIQSGEIKVYKAKEKEQEKKNHTIVPNTYIKKIEKRIPRLAVSILGRGKLIGNNELHDGKQKYELTYEANYSGCEVFEIPASIYTEYFCIPEIRELPVYQDIENYNKKKTNEQSARYDRTRVAFQNMVTNPAVVCQSVKIDLLSVLHNMIDMKEATSFSLHMTNNDGNNKATVSIFDSEEMARSRPNSRINSPSKSKRSVSPTTSRMLESRDIVNESRVNNFSPPSREQRSTQSPRKSSISNNRNFL